MEEASDNPEANPEARDTNEGDEICGWSIEEEVAVEIAVAGLETAARENGHKDQAGRDRQQNIETCIARC